MKKMFLIIAASLISITALVAQPRAIGIRFGYANEVSYQHSIGGDKTYLQVDAGLLGLGAYGAQAVGTYNWIFATPDWTDYGSWEWFAGVGAGLGSYWGNHYNNSFFVGAAGNVGLSYTFEFPLQLSADFRPVIGPRFYDGAVGLHTNAFVDFAISARYRF